MRPTLDQYYLSMLELVASRATCPRRQVAAIITDEQGRLVSIGYNGNPTSMTHCIDNPCKGAPPHGRREDCEAVHAETNAVIQAQASRRQPHTVYCSTTPCFACAKLLITAGIKRVVAASIYAHDSSGTDLLVRAGLDLTCYKENTACTQIL